jgi:hypothetical protein
MLGSRDNRVLMPEGEAIFGALAGEKQFEIFEGLGHESLFKGKREQWLGVVGPFLGRLSSKAQGAGL